MLYPLTPCDTQPLIDVRNIVLNNVQQHGNLLTPGIVRCHETNKCTGFIFQNVNARSWWSLFGLNYITENVEGTVVASKPEPDFGQKSIEGGDLSMVFQEYLIEMMRDAVSDQKMATAKFGAAASVFDKAYSNFVY